MRLEEGLQALSVGRGFLPNVAVAYFKKQHTVAIFTDKVPKIGVVFLQLLLFIFKHRFFLNLCKFGIHKFICHLACHTSRTSELTNQQRQRIFLSAKSEQHLV